MSKRVLFVIPPPLGDLVASHEGSAGMGALAPRAKVFAYPPYTTALCAADARAGGWSVRVVDGASWTTAKLAAAVAREDAEVLAVLVAAGTADGDLTFLRILRAQLHAPHAPPVLLFGPSASVIAKEWLAEGVAQAALAGEPDMAIAAALNAVLEGQSGMLDAFALCPGAYKPDGLVADLDALPFPAWDLVPWQPYEMVNLLSSRGCPSGCRYCAYVLTQGKSFRCQSVARTLAEWQWLADEVRPPYLIVRDPVFAHDRPRVIELCEGISRLGLNLAWACESRPEHFDRELVVLMGAARCATIKIGLESGDGALLARVGRLDSPAAAEAYVEPVARVSRWCEEAGVRCRVFLMAGLPGQGPAADRATVAAVRRIAKSATIHPNVYRAYEGVALPGASQPVPAAALEALRSANRTAPSLLARVVRLAHRRLGHNAAAPPTSAATATLSQPAPVHEKMREREYLLAGSRVFLTGGSGFVGGYVARALIDAGAEVFALLRPGSPPGALAQLKLHCVRGDLAEPAYWSEVLRGCRFCFNVAALYAGADHAAAMYAVNVRATGALLAACAEAGVARFIHTSTIGTVGRPSNGSLPDESTPFNQWDQVSHYARSKWMGELVARSWNGAGMDVVIVKPAAPVGPGDGAANRPPSATGRRMLAALRGEKFAYPAGGINHAPVQDIAAGHLLAAERGEGGECYILGHAQGNLDRDAFLRLVKVPHASAANYGPEALTANPARAIVELGLPQSDLSAAFAAAVDYYKLNLLEQARDHVVAS
jgi:nucleoside-diphosphate-sugar epimerase